MHRFVSVLIPLLVLLPGSRSLGHFASSSSQDPWASLRVEPHTVLVKFSISVSASLYPTSVPLAHLSVPFTRYGVWKMERLYPTLPDPRFSTGIIAGGIDRLYRITFAGNQDPREVARALSRESGIEYAEPEVVHHLLVTPDDPMLSQQYALDRIHAKEAWDLTTGGPEIVIAIVDSGVRWTHEDLRDNIWINPGEDVNKDGRYTIVDQNGIDDDGNGYIDDIVGVDLVGDVETNGGSYYDNNPSPTETGNPHGTHVAGIAAAAGNNTRGIAGVAYRCRILPVKCGADNGGTSILRGYDGIVYAAMMGARVINCSWGGGGYMQNEVDRIAYAVSRGAVVVAAAGNDGEERTTTPGAYPNVLCVANVDARDVINPSSTYGPQVDVSAPGTSILSTVSSTDASYESFGWSGTSMASPMAAGVVALVAAAYPQFLPSQIAEKVRVSAESIDDQQVPKYAGKIGFGRVNAYRALTVSSPAIRMTRWTLDDARLGNGNGIIERGETVELLCTWKNWLDAASAPVATLSSSNPRVTVVSGRFELGPLQTLDSSRNTASPFVVRIAEDLAPNDRIDFDVAIDDGAYHDHDGFFVYQQPTYRDHTVNRILTTLSNTGHIGFDDFSTTKGKGFVYDAHGVNVIFEGGLMIGARVANQPRVVDVVRDETGQRQKEDFTGMTEFDMRTPGSVAAQQGFTRFSDSSVDERDRLGVDVDLHSYAFVTPGLEKSVFLRYRIHNRSQNALDDLHAGLFFDWDVGPSSQSDRAVYDTALGLAQVYDSKGEVKTQVGVAVLSHSAPALYCGIENGDQDQLPVFGIYNGFSKSEKWSALSAGIVQPFTNATDVSHVVSTGPYFLSPGDSVEVAFLVGAGESFEDLRAQLGDARAQWARVTSPTDVMEPAMPDNLRIESLYPLPLRGTEFPLMIRLYVVRPENLTFILRDVRGREIVRQRRILPAGVQELPLSLPATLGAGMYFLEVDGHRVHQQRLVPVFHP